MSLHLNQLLFPTDFSENSKKVLPFALELARRSKAKLTLVHSIEEPYDFAPMIEELRQSISRKVQSLFEELLDEIAEDSRYSDLKIETRILNGRIATAILDEAREIDADIIIMGTAGASGLKKVLFGSHTTEVIMHSPIPVLAVPEESHFNGLEHITFLTDYGNEDVKALGETATLGKLFNADISVVHIEKEHDLKAEIMFRGFKELVSKQIPYSSMDFELIIQDTFDAGVGEFIKSNNTSLLTLVRYKKPFFSSLFNKQHSREFGFYTNVPLLVLIGE